ncbi:hypothetical protein [Streptomyces sp. NPDC015345]|uniref:hypothetical protein n=1 Tax=Streptomyces sp. NPDC015345 TaxID=3364953 RepID=UPI0036F69E74
MHSRVLALAAALLRALHRLRQGVHQLDDRPRRAPRLLGEASCRRPWTGAG